MGLLKFFGFENQTQIQLPSPLPHNLGNYNFSTPFATKIGEGDITKPNIQVNYRGENGYIYFGSDNLYPQLINQMFYTSPLFASLVKFTVQSAIGGGFEIENASANGADKVALQMFLKGNKIASLLRYAAMDRVLHGRVHFKITKNKENVVIKIERDEPSKVRTNADRSLYYVSYNWQMRNDIKILKTFNLNGSDAESMLSFEDFENSPGQDIYPLPSHISCLNWVALDGKTSTLQKENIEKSIYPSIIIKRPKEFQSEEEFQKFQDNIRKIQGTVQSAIVLAGNTKELVPEIESFPTQNNDKLFLQTDEAIQTHICAALSIDPLLAGIRTTGKMGSGTDIEQARNIFEKNVIHPLINVLEEIFDDLMHISNIKGSFKIKKLEITNDVIRQTPNI